MTGNRQVQTLRILVCWFVITMIGKYSLAQKDSLILKNRDVIVGEIKSLKDGVLIVETSYSDKDFAIEWSGVREIYSKTRFLLTLKDGTRLNGYVSMSSDSGRIKISEDGVSTRRVFLENLVYMQGLESKFWSRLNATIDLGLNLTKANNLRQISTRSTFGYQADRWAMDAYFNYLRSQQDSILPTDRIDAGYNYTYFLQRDWFLAASITFLSSTEQALALRTSGKVGGGKLLKHTNRAYWGVGAGLNFNNEVFSNETPSRNSLEVMTGTELNLFDIGDLNFKGNWYVYKSVTQGDRWRSDLKFDTKYDLPWDFYIRLGLTLNYDNRPAAIGKETDYVFNLSFGWELD